MTDENNAIIVGRDEYRTAPRSQWPITEEKKRADHSGLISVAANVTNGSSVIYTVPAGFIGIITHLYYENLIMAGGDGLIITDGTGVVYQEANAYSRRQVIPNGDVGAEVVGAVTVTTIGATDTIYVNATVYLVLST